MAKKPSRKKSPPKPNAAPKPASTPKPDPSASRRSGSGFKPKPAPKSKPRKPRSAKPAVRVVGTGPDAPTDLIDPWLIAVWPGMGNIALLAGGFLAAKLDMQLIAEIPPLDLFDVEQVEVHHGIATQAPLPRSRFFLWRDPRKQRDLLVFIGEAQPPRDQYAFAKNLLAMAARFGVDRFFTFAAMATQLQPGDPARVFAAVTDGQMLKELTGKSIEQLVEGQITGLNGVLLAAGAERGMHGVCLLGEMPFFAVQAPNPRGAAAVLRAFADLSSIPFDLAEMDEQAEQVDRMLIQAMQQWRDAMRRQREQAGDDEDSADDESDVESFQIPEFTAEITPQTDDASTDEPAPPAAPDQPDLPDPARRRIERLFREARKDRSKAMQLKAELDRWNVFKQYEDRFLDLFKRAD